jgi:hypothetical protein
VTKKIVPETDVAMRAFDETRDVSDRGAFVSVEFDDADDRIQGCE